VITGTVLIALLVAAAFYFFGVVARGLAILGVCLIAIAFMHRMGAWEIAAAVGVVVFLACKGFLNPAVEWVKKWLKPPEPPDAAGGDAP
jgi:Ni,Fe-hydrogenase I cytochrome b subunit